MAAGSTMWDSLRRAFDGIRSDVRPEPVMDTARRDARRLRESVQLDAYLDALDERETRRTRERQKAMAARFTPGQLERMARAAVSVRDIGTRAHNGATWRVPRGDELFDKYKEALKNGDFDSAAVYRTAINHAPEDFSSGRIVPWAMSRSDADRAALSDKRVPELEPDDIAAAWWNAVDSYMDRGADVPEELAPEAVFAKRGAVSNLLDIPSGQLRAPILPRGNRPMWRDAPERDADAATSHFRLTDLPYSGFRSLAGVPNGLDEQSIVGDMAKYPRPRDAEHELSPEERARSNAREALRQTWRKAGLNVDEYAAGNVLVDAGVNIPFDEVDSPTPNPDLRGRQLVRRYRGLPSRVLELIDRGVDGPRAAEAYLKGIADAEPGHMPPKFMSNSPRAGAAPDPGDRSQPPEKINPMSAAFEDFYGRRAAKDVVKALAEARRPGTKTTDLQLLPIDPRGTVFEGSNRVGAGPGSDAEAVQRLAEEGRVPRELGGTLPNGEDAPTTHVLRYDLADRGRGRANAQFAQVLPGGRGTQAAEMVSPGLDGQGHQVANHELRHTVSPAEGAYDTAAIDTTPEIDIGPGNPKAFSYYWDNLAELAAALGNFNAGVAENSRRTKTGWNDDATTFVRSLDDFDAALAQMFPDSMLMQELPSGLNPPAPVGMDKPRKPEHVGVPALGENAKSWLAYDRIDRWPEDFPENYAIREGSLDELYLAALRERERGVPDSENRALDFMRRGRKSAKDRQWSARSAEAENAEMDRRYAEDAAAYEQAAKRAADIDAKLGDPWTMMETINSEVDKSPLNFDAKDLVRDYLMLRNLNPDRVRKALEDSGKYSPEDVERRMKSFGTPERRREKYNQLRQTLKMIIPQVGKAGADTGAGEVYADAKGGDTRADAKGGDSPGSETAVSEPPVSEPVPEDYRGPRIVVNPSTFKNKKDALCVAFNEAFRVLMELNGFEPMSEPTGKQRRFFSDTAYANDELQLRRTILARIATFDTSVKDPTPDQVGETLEFLHTVLEIGAPQNEWEQQAVQRLIDGLESQAGSSTPTTSSSRTTR